MSVDSSIHWMEWGDGAFRRAQSEDKPVLLALTATWCHWCHVMDQTSYSDPQVISLIDSRFIAVRVDVDQRPDISHRYNQGGFPSVAVLDDRGELITGRVYAPAEELVRFLEQASSQYPGKGPVVQQPVDPTLTLPTDLSSAGEPDSPEPGSEVISVLRRLTELYDADFGGFGFEPKQPPWEAVGLLLARYGHTRDRSLLRMATKTLDGIRAGLYDQKDEGFFRYSVSRDWKTPHYEKMLCTNAGLASTYVEAYQLTGRRAYRQAGLGALRYMLDALFDQSRGLFYASQDAGESYYALPWGQREQAEKPRIDRTFYTGWNALAASSLLKGFGAVGDESYLRVARGVLDRLWREGWSQESGLCHTLEAPGKSATEAPGPQTRYLSDQVHVFGAFLDLHQATGDPQALQTAIQIAECTQKLFGVSDGGYHDVCDPSPDPDPMLRPVKPLLENSLMAEALIRLSYLTGQEDWERQARETLSLFRDVAPGSSYLGPPSLRRMEEDEERLYLPAAAAWGRAWDMLVQGPVHMVLVGALSNRRTRLLLKSALRVYAPHRIVQVLDTQDDEDRISSLGFPVDGPPALYACMSGMCLAPIYAPEQVRGLASERPWAGSAPFRGRAVLHG
ncbi:MAG: thioredoxin domain-containing protein [Chloroflexi bacterium]|nr:thioredoxin domain-containing protein [Chloroflexota bacterium]